MDIQAEKLDLIQWLVGIDDSKIIKQFMLLKKSSQGNVDAALSQREKDAIDIGLKSMKDGRSKSHKQVVEATKNPAPGGVSGNPSDAAGFRRVPSDFVLVPGRGLEPPRSCPR